MFAQRQRDEAPVMNGASVGRLLRYLPVAVWGRPLRGAERYRPFFIVGSGRCGSTLLRALLEAHPVLHVPPENSLGALVTDYRRYSRLPWNAVLRIVLGELEFRYRWDRFGLELGPLFRELAALRRESRNLAAVLNALYRAHGARHKPAATRWGDKTPANVFALDGLLAVFPDMKAIHIVRDGRDVVRSFMEATREPLPAAAARWLRAVRAAHAFRDRHPAVYHELRYEDLVREPRAALERVTAFLGEQLHPDMLRHDELGLPLEDIRGLAFLEPVRGPIHQGAVGRWRTAFDAAQIAELNTRLGPTLAALGYDARSGAVT